MPNKSNHQAPPDRVNELFEKLLATSDNAVKTRERLFVELKEELELLASLQEQYLFPILDEHGMRDLVQQAIDGNQETGTLLAQLDGMPRNSSDFLDRVTELRRLFQQHIRADRKELLPATLKVLSDEEAVAVAEKVEEEVANIDSAKRNQARDDREQNDGAQQVAESLTETVQAAAEGLQIVSRTMQEAMGSSLGVATEFARISMGQGTVSARTSEKAAQEVSEQASQSLWATAETGNALTRGFEDIAREYMERSQKRWETNLEGLSEMARCRSWADLLAVQGSLIRENMEQTLNNSRRWAELSMQMAGEVTGPAAMQAEKATQRIRRVV